MKWRDERLPSGEVDLPPGEILSVGPAMTLRDWFAGMALLATCMRYPRVSDSTRDMARWAFDIADAMLVERDEEPADGQ